MAAATGPTRSRPRERGSRGDETATQVGVHLAPACMCAHVTARAPAREFCPLWLGHRPWRLESHGRARRGAASSLNRANRPNRVRLLASLSVFSQYDSVFSQLDLNCQVGLRLFFVFLHSAKKCPLFLRVGAPLCAACGRTAFDERELPLVCCIRSPTRPCMSCTVLELEHEAPAPSSDVSQLYGLLGARSVLMTEPHPPSLCGAPPAPTRPALAHPRCPRPIQNPARPFLQRPPALMAASTERYLVPRLITCS